MLPQLQCENECDHVTKADICSCTFLHCSESKLTQLTQDAFGGNCKTRIICCLPPKPEIQRLSAVLRTCATLSQVKNFPVLNDHFVEVRTEKH